MWGRVVEVSADNRYLSVTRGFLKVDGPDGEVGRIPLDDIACLINSGHGCTITNNVIAALAERGAPVVMVNHTFQPCAMLYPLGQHGETNARIAAQLDSCRPTAKRLWQRLVQRKIEAQAAALERRAQPHAPVLALARQVRSGDPDNIEAQAARRYWPLLMGPDFRRHPEQNDINVLLNYGYTILRSATARAVAAAGLHPALGIHHKTRGDALALADDLMEPFRPAVDLRVRTMADTGVNSLTPDAKKALVAVLGYDYATGEGTTPLGTCLVRLTQSLADVYLKRRDNLVFPDSLLPLPDAPTCQP